MDRSIVMVVRSRLLIPTSCARVREGAVDLMSVPHFHEWFKAGTVHGIDKCREPVAKDACDEEHRIRPECLCFNNLAHVDDKILPQHRHADRVFDRAISAPEPPKKYSSVRTEIPTHPPSARTPAIIAMSTFLRITPPDGEAHLISAITGFFFSAERIAASRLACRNPSAPGK